MALVAPLTLATTAAEGKAELADLKILPIWALLHEIELKNHQDMVFNFSSNLLSLKK